MKRVLIGLLFFLTGCGDATSPRKVYQAEWTSLGFRTQHPWQLLCSEGTLYVAAGGDGVFAMPLHATGSWTQLDWASIVEGGETAQKAVSLAMTSRSLLVSVAGDDIQHPLFRYSNPDSVWIPVDTGYGKGSGTAVWAQGDTVLLATTKFPPVLVSLDAGDTWGQAMDVPEGMAFLGTLIVQSANTLFYACLNNREIPLLFMAHSPSGPWEVVPLRVGSPASYLLDGQLTGVGASGSTDADLLIAHNASIYGTALLSEPDPFVGRLPSGICILTRADRRSPDVFVTGDSLYMSPDAGLTWTSYASPHGGSLITSIVDWDRGVLYSVEWLDGWGEVFQVDVRSLISD